MKNKLMAVLFCLAIAMFFATSGNAQTTTTFVGSSGAFNSFAVAANGTATCGSNMWSQGSTSGNGAVDVRSGNVAGSASIPLEKGSIWVLFNGSSTGVGTTAVCAYVSVDSIVGNRMFFGTGTIPAGAQGAGGTGHGFMVVTNSTGGGQKVALVPDTVTTLPANVTAALNGVQFSAAASDIRPEDAQFESSRVLGGLGYANPPGGSLGFSIGSFYNNSSAQVVGFSINGSDPISSASVPAYSVINVGAYPIIIFANTTATTNAGDFGNLHPNNILTHSAAAIFSGRNGLTTDVTGAAFTGINGTPNVPAGSPMTVLIREPISGTYTTFDFQDVNAKGTNFSQEDPFSNQPVHQYTTPYSVGAGACLDANHCSNPGHRVDSNGATWNRVIGTGQMVNEVSALPNSIGYAFWTFSTFAASSTVVPGNMRYLDVDGVDPLFASYASPVGTNGVFPTCAPTCTALTFPNIQKGNYRLWNIIRVITSSSAPAGVTNLVTGAQNQTVAPASPLIPDFVPFIANGNRYLTVYRSHYSAPNITNPDIHNGCLPSGVTGVEGGGDVAGGILNCSEAYDTFVNFGGIEETGVIQ